MTGDEQKLAREIGLVLRRLRRAQSLTQRGLAQRAADGVDAAYIGMIERGDQLPSLKVLLRLSKALGVAVSDFFAPPRLTTAEPSAALFHVEPLLHALHNRGIDGVAFVRALLDVVGQYVLVAPPRRGQRAEPECVLRADPRTAIPLPAAKQE